MDPPKSGTLHVPIIWNQNSVGISLQTLSMGTVPLFNGSIIFFTCHVKGKFDGIYKIVFYVVLIQQGFCRDDSDLHSILYWVYIMHSAINLALSKTLHMIIIMIINNELLWHLVINNNVTDISASLHHKYT